MPHCINIKHPEYRKLLEQSGIKQELLNAKISVWQEKNGLDKFPSVSDLSNIKPGVPELFESNPELANAVYEALGFEIKSYDKPWKDGSNNINKAISFALKNKPTEIFELVKDKEDKNYSVHFKTTKTGSLTNEEKQKLIEVIASNIPIKSKLSTWGTVTKGGFAGLERFTQAGFRKTSENRDSGGNIIPVYEKISKSNLEQQAQQLYSDFLDKFVKRNFDKLVSEMESKNLIEKKCN